MIYIQRKDQYNLETVDHADDIQEARRLLAEYRLSEPYIHYYLSNRACHYYLSNRACKGYWPE